jgi:hypothetical protein
MPDYSLSSVKWLRGDDRAVSVDCVVAAILGQRSEACNKQDDCANFRYDADKNRGENKTEVCASAGGIRPVDLQ